MIISKNKWSRILLSDIATITSGQSAPQGVENFSNNGYPFIRAGSIERIIADKSYNSLEKISKEIANKYRLKRYDKGSVLFAKSGMSCLKNRVLHLGTSCFVVSHLAIITPKKNLDSYYLRYFLQNYKPSRLIKDSSYPSISLEAIGKIQISIPPIPIQKQI